MTVRLKDWTCAHLPQQGWTRIYLLQGLIYQPCPRKTAMLPVQVRNKVKVNKKKKKSYASPFINNNPSLSGPRVPPNSTIFNVQETLANLQKRWFKALVMLNILAHTFLNRAFSPITAWNSLCSNFSASLLGWLLHPHLSSKGLTQSPRSFSHPLLHHLCGHQQDLSKHRSGPHHSTEENPSQTLAPWIWSLNSLAQEKGQGPPPLKLEDSQVLF